MSDHSQGIVNSKNSMEPVPFRVAVLALALIASSQLARSQKLAQPMRLVILGTGTPVADPARSGPGVAIVVGSEAYIVDAGPGIVRRAAAAAGQGFPALQAQNLRHVFITHLHSDHTVGLPDLMLSPWPLGRRTPLEVYGPVGIRRMTRLIEEAWEEDEQKRMFGPEGLRRPNYKAVTHEIEAGTIFDDGTVRVDAIAVAHASWPAAFGYRFETADRKIVVSGDTRPTQALADACNKCDVLVHEVYSSTLTTRDATGQLQSPGSYHSMAHTSTAQLAALATKAQPRLLVLYHQLYGTATDADLELEVRRAGYRGRVVSAKDLDSF
jgi:ribonuclease BN (tRNA processing enzyme)